MESYDLDGASNVLLLVVGMIAQLSLLWRSVFLAVMNRRDIARRLHKLVDHFFGEKDVFILQESEESAPSTRLVAEKVCKRRLKVGRMFLNGLAVSMALVLASIQLNIIRDRPRWMNAALSWMCVCLTILASLPLLVPQSLSAGTLDFFFLALMVATAVALSPLCCPPDQLQLLVLLVIVLIRMPAICLPTRTWLIAISNLLISGMVVMRVLLEDFESGCLHRSTYPILWTDAVCSFVIIGVGYGLDALFKQNVHQDLRYSKATEELSAATSLLRLTCDAVVELDEDLCLTDHSKELAAILLRDRPGSTLAGLSFTDFVASADEAARVVEFLMAENLFNMEGNKEGISAHAFHTRLVDSCSSKFRTEVFQVKYRKQDGQVHHLLGLRDFTDQKALAGPHAIDALQEEPAIKNRLVSSSPEQSYGSELEPTSGEGQKSAQYRVLFLELDLERQVVDAASVPAACLVGMSLPELFPGAGWDSMQKLWHDVVQNLAQESSSQSPKVHSFRRLAVQWGPQMKDVIDGTIEVLLADKSARSPPRLLMRCQGSAPGGRDHSKDRGAKDRGSSSKEPVSAASERSRQSSISEESRDCFGPVVPGRLSSSLIS